MNINPSQSSVCLKRRRAVTDDRHGLMSAWLRGSLRKSKKGTDIFLLQEKPSQRSENLTLCTASAVITAFAPTPSPSPKTFPTRLIWLLLCRLRQELGSLEVSMERNFSISEPSVTTYDHSSILKTRVGKASGINKTKWEENPTNLRTFVLGWRRKARCTSGNEKGRKRGGWESVRGKPYWSGGLINHQMPLTQPLIFCDLWQSGTALGEMVGMGQEWIKEN